MEQRGKTSIPSVSGLLNAVSADSLVMVYPLDRAVIEGVGLAAIHEMHDHQIVSTSRRNSECINVLSKHHSIRISFEVQVVQCFGLLIVRQNLERNF